MRTNRFDINRMTRSNTGGGGGAVIAPYALPVAADGVLGGIQLGYIGTDKYYPVQLDDQQRAFVNVPWTSVIFGADGDGYVPITIGSTTKNVLTSHQSLAGYATESWVTQRGYATQDWVNQNYLSIEWFDKLFKLYNGEESEANKIAPNGTLPSDTANLNIEAMFGFWTKQYISALGRGDDGGGGGQGDVTWVLLADNNDTRQIASSHLTTALSGYATQSYVLSQINALEYFSSISATDGVVTFTTNKSNTTILDFNHVHSWAEILDKPTNLSVFTNDVGYALTSQIPTNNNQLTNGAGYVTSSGVTSVATGTGLTGGTITSTGTIAINSTYLGYISNGNTAYGWGNHANAGYVKSSGVTSVATGTGLTGGTITSTGTIAINSTYLGYISNGNTAYGWGNHANYGYATTSWVSGNYLPLTGGTISGKLGIGTSPSYKLHVDGDIYATGGVTALSDARHKNIKENVDLSVEHIAKMQAVRYSWKNDSDKKPHVGSIAQDWENILPEVVLIADNKERTRSLQYGVAALISSIITARKVMDHEQRIIELERENKELKAKLKIA